VERRVEVDGATLHAEGLATDRDRVAVLLAGAAMQATAWEDEPIGILLDADLGVVRFDWRDIGRSTWARFADTPYTIGTLVDDVLAVADAFGLERFDLVGFSMGGCVAQLLALDHPEHIATMSLVSSGHASVIDVERPDRGGALLELFARPRPVDDAEAAERLVDQWRLLCGSATPFDESAWRGRARAWVERGQNPSCPHIRLGPQVFGVDRHHQLQGLQVPALVVHGTDDPMFPIAHGVALAETLPIVTFEALDGRGHDLHLDVRVPRMIADHIRSNDP
jgi:pimeloyl-ACP methyl ester carboxylesterase